MFIPPPSERLKFRPLTLQDTDAWMEYINSAEALKFMPFRQGDKDECLTWMQRQLSRYEETGMGLFALIVKETNELAGQCGLLIQEVDEKKELEIGYHLIPRFWKNGFATEAAVAFRNLAFEKNLAASLISIIHIDNIASQKVALRNGMTKEKQTVFKNLPVFVFRITREKWLTNKNS